MIKGFILALAIVHSTATMAYDHKPGLQRVRTMWEGSTYTQAQLIDEALDSALKEAQRQLWKAGSPDLAEQLRYEWEGTYKGSLLRMNDEGDHEPLSAWLAVWYMALEAALGHRTMEMTHLVDIKTFNFSIPVALHPHASATWCQEQLAIHPADTCQAEYRRHLAGTKYTPDDPFAEDPHHHGLCGVTTYWVVFAGCEAALWGTDWTLLCGLAGDAGEAAMDRFAAPRISDKLWQRNNP